MALSAAQTPSSNSTSLPSWAGIIHDLPHPPPSLWASLNAAESLSLCVVFGLVVNFISSRHSHQKQALAAERFSPDLSSLIEASLTKEGRLELFRELQSIMSRQGAERRIVLQHLINYHHLHDALTTISLRVYSSLKNEWRAFLQEADNAHLPVYNTSSARVGTLECGYERFRLNHSKLSLEVRESSPEDLTEIVLAHNESFGGNDHTNTLQRQLREDRAKGIASQFWVVRETNLGKILGCWLLRKEVPPYPHQKREKILVINNVARRAFAAQANIFQSLWDHLQKNRRSFSDCPVAELEVLIDNPIQNVYAKHGFFYLRKGCYKTRPDPRHLSDVTAKSVDDRLRGKHVGYYVMRCFLAAGKPKGSV